MRRGFESHRTHQKFLSSDTIFRVMIFSKDIPYHYFLWLMFFSLIILELASFFFPELGGVGMYLWMVVSLLILLISIYSFYYFFNNVQTNHKVFLYVAWVIMFVFIIYNAPKNSNISYETTQEAACSLKLLRESENKGFQQSCFLGYPARQYLMLVLPSIFFKPSLVSLNIGGSLYFLAAQFFWGVGLYHYFKRRSNYPSFFSALGILLLLHFFYFNHFLFHCFEQSQFPLSLSMAFWGIYLWKISDSQKWHLPLLGLLLLFIVQSYTPSLAFFFLAVLLLLNLYKYKESKKLILIVIIGGLASLFFSFTFRSDIKLVSKDHSNLSFLFNEGWLLVKHLFWKAQGFSDYSSIIGKIVLAMAFFSPFFDRSKKSILLVLWVILTMFVATISQGYSFYGLDMRAHRSTVILPTAIILALISFQFVLKKIKINSLILSIIFIIIASSGLWYGQSYLLTKTYHHHLYLLNYLQENISGISESELIIFTDQSNKNFISLNDSLKYFFPHLKKIQASYEKFEQYSTDSNSILIVEEDEKIYVPNSFIYSGEIRLINDCTLLVFTSS